MEIQEIKNYMKRNKISYERLAEMTGLSKSTITKIFGGFAKYPRVDTMKTIEHALGLEHSNHSLISELTDEQKDLLSMYDKMTPAQKARLIGYAEGLLGENLADNAHTWKNA